MGRTDPVVVFVPRSVGASRLPSLTRVRALLFVLTAARGGRFSGALLPSLVRRHSGVGMRRYRVVQWATGHVGQRALRAVLERDVFELVGVHAFSPDKVGIDAGALAGTAPVGVLATDDVDALIGIAPDCVVYRLRTGGSVASRWHQSGATGDFLTGTNHPKERPAL